MSGGLPVGEKEAKEEMGGRGYRKDLALGLALIVEVC